MGDARKELPGAFDTVVLAWPPLGKPFGRQVLERMARGALLVYEGEGEGGCTGDAGLFAALRKPGAWQPMPEASARLNRRHVRFHSIHDAWAVYRKL